jgi:hypothetical protein
MPAITMVNMVSETDRVALFTVLVLTGAFKSLRKSENRRKRGKKTRLQYLVRHKSGRYYARVYTSGKEVWKSLGTSHFSVAQAKLVEFLKEHRALT